MKKLFKYLKVLVLIIVINQIIILISNDSIRNGWWKSNSENRFNEHDFLEFDSNLNWNIITEKGKKSGIVQLYIGKKLLISNLTLTEWYLYENKG
ncbi:hypothetical protein UMM65_08330 [Aureibaculum sp. 2210JD6-5]|uniref:hypothetical protein n=1 Tax=Aureibaculum sp. 2210JD6-5 TaxID=3103957 RepID=UPI002AACFBD6|nr:hypothetical protein [Aureibaculum sp. 2210JD6-5]MDY7395247.1 hypothetical protein [Aureibaculum sp. 2210JD6-5]